MPQTKRFWKIFAASATLVSGAVTATLYTFLYGNTQSFYDRLVLPIFHRLDPEVSHKLAIHILEFYRVPFALEFDQTNELKCRIQELPLPNPVGLAAGFDKDGKALFNLSQFGFGFIEIGSITPEPQPGNEKPRVFRLPEDKAIINRYGFNSVGHYEVLKRLKVIKEHYVETPLGINLGVNKDSESPVNDYIKGIRKFGDVADYFVINVSSPNTPGLRDLQKKESLETVIMETFKVRDLIKKKTKPLLFLKLSPDLTSEERQDIANIVMNETYRIDGLIICNTTIQRPAELKSPHKTEAGGLSGLPLKQRSTQMIAEMYKLTKGEIPIIGVGGIFTGEDAYEKIKAGASAIQIYTSFIYHGAPIVLRIREELTECLKKDGYHNVMEAIGKDVNLE